MRFGPSHGIETHFFAGIARCRRLDVEYRPGPVRSQAAQIAAVPAH